ncbi:MAG: homoserine kinase [Candidatus Kerfeldbacteria bacterium RIFCSPLOWO2_02_FULL_42_19]|nr:MAG: homoserine kinase [Candidatus Kerfeldbacteria bacterium RIFCSPLOWO2_02_FULL_42_19]
MKVKVRVPATAANLGAGFNCLGLALELYNAFEVTECRAGIKIEITGKEKDALPKDKTNLFLQAADRVFKKCGYAPKGLRIKINSCIPIARGLGSSAAAIVAGAVAANELCQKKLSQDDLMQLCADLEGHPDNITAAFLGGLTICGYEDGKLIYTNVFVRYGLRAIIAVPQNLKVKTKDAVAVLPKRVPFADAVFNLSRVAFFINGMMTDELEIMGLGMDDRLHQSYRKRLIPGLEDVFRTAKGAGAHGVALSGAGPSVVAITNRFPDPIGEAMKKAFAVKGIKAEIMILDADNEGVTVKVKRA